MEVLVDDGAGSVGVVAWAVFEYRPCMPGYSAFEGREHALIESAPMAMLMVDRDGVVVLANPEAARMTRWPREELLGLQIGALIPARMRAGHPAKREQYLRRPEARRMGSGQVLHALRKDGTEFPVEIGLSPVFTSEGPFTMCTMADISERIALEQERERLIRELQRSNNDLELFASFASHDLRAPARQILGMAGLLRDRLGGALDDEAREYLDLTSAAAERMQKLIRDLLAYAKLDSDLPQTPVALPECVHDAVQLHQDAIDESAAQVAIGELPVVTGCPSQLTQLFVNLIGNALKYRGEDPPRVEITADSSPDGGWIVSVADNGMGIAPKYRDLIFEPFRRLHGVGKFGGSGIGLAICRRVVEAHGGRIWVESNRDMGATFRFTLPA